MENAIMVRQHEEKRLAALRASPEQYFKELQPRTIDDVFASFEPSLGYVLKKDGVLVARAAVAYVIAETLDFFNVSETMNDSQVAFTTDLILEEYPYFKLDDLKLCFRNAMKLKYGNVYNRIDGQIIFRWLKQYNIDRCNLAERDSFNNHKRLLEESQKSEGLFFDNYRKQLEERVRDGDKSATEALKSSNWIGEELKRRRINKQKAENEEFWRKREIEKQNKQQ